MSAQTIENVVLERLVPDLESQGYDVFVHPSKQIVPSFLGTYVPDLIALRDDKNLVIEIKHRGGRAENLLKDLAKRFEGQKQWEFRVVWISQNESRDEPKLQSRETISTRLKEISRLLDAGFFDSAMLIAWATFEAIGRKLMPKEFARPQSPGRLVEVLAQEGHITPDESDVLRQLVDMRNRLIHGELAIAISRLQVESFLKILSSLANNIGLSEAH
jgi:uncharacterized protein YutE (UPF0331/DUF86 family)